MLAMTIVAAMAGALTGEPGASFVRRDVEVPIADLDLSQAGDVAELRRRLGPAASRACGSVDGTDPQARAEHEACRRDALKRAELAYRARAEASRTTGEAMSRAE